MKKLLIATTALVGTAGVVAADTANFNFNGYGRFGILYEEDRTDDGAEAEETRIESRYRLNIDSSTETDGGIRFAARVRIQADEESNGEAGTAGLNGARFQVSSGGLRVRVGNISGVTDAAEVINFFGFEPGLVGQVGHYGTFGAGSAIDAYAVRDNGVTGINVKYEMGDFAVMASYSPDYDSNLPNAAATTDDFETFEIGASYTVSGWTFGAVYGDYSNEQAEAEDFDFYALTATGTLGVADVAFFVGDTDIEGDDVAYGISGSFPVGAATNIVASVAGGGADDLEEEFGIGFTHSLGGGVSLSGMVGQNTADNTVADLGVRFNF